MNNVTAFPNQLAIKEEAGTWMVRIDQGDLSNEETAQLREWINRSDFHHQYLEKLARNWDNMAILQELADLFPLFGQEPERGQQSKRLSLLTGFLPHLRPAVLAASALAVVVVLITIFSGQQATHLSTQPDSQRNFVTRVGEQNTIQLEDGSTIALNTDSRIDVDYSGDRRVVRLLRGEANFIVAKNPQRPFVVYAGGGMIWAVGTAFNVRYTSDLVDVIVTEGTVKVYTQVNPDKPIANFTTAPVLDGNNPTTSENEALVSAGKSMQYSNVIQSLEPALPIILEQKLAWQQGALIFKGETLEQALAEIARYTDIELIIVDPAIKTLRVGGHFKTDDIDGLLATLSQGFDINLSYVAENRIHLSKKNPQ